MSKVSRFKLQFILHYLTKEARLALDKKVYFHVLSKKMGQVSWGGVNGSYIKYLVLLCVVLVSLLYCLCRSWAGWLQLRSSAVECFNLSIAKKQSTYLPHRISVRIKCISTQTH